MSTHEGQTLEQRITALESLIRKQRFALLAIPVVALLLGAAASQVADWKGKSVTTEKLILVDSDGKERGAWFVQDSEPVIEFYHKDHSLILNAGVSPDNRVGFIQFFDAQGNFKTGFGGNAVK